MDWMNFEVLVVGGGGGGGFGESAGGGGGGAVVYQHLQGITMNGLPGLQGAIFPNESRGYKELAPVPNHTFKVVMEAIHSLQALLLTIPRQVPLPAISAIWRWWGWIL